MNSSTRRAWMPRYEADELAVGVALALVVHALPLAAIVYKANHGGDSADETPQIARPVVAATLLKLGKPMDPRQLPDRLVPRARTAPKPPDVVASREEPTKKTPPDAGAPRPKDTQDSDLLNLIAKTDPFAEDAGRTRPEEGRAEGIKGGTETDPSKVRAGDQYAAQLGAFFHERWQYPTVISQGEANKLCVVFRVSTSPRMLVWHVQQSPVRSSGNELFDDSARSMLQKLLDEKIPLPPPPPEVAELYSGRSLELVLQGNPHGDGSKCR